MPSRLSRFEAPVVHWFSRFERYRRLRPVMLLATRAGDGWALLVLVPLALATGRARGVAVVGCGVLSALATAGIVHGTKWLVRRHRPSEIDLLRPITAPDLHAFPSGHTAQAFAALVLAAWLTPWFGLLLAPAAVLVGLSRIFFGLHYPSDVVAGAVLGAGIAALTIAACDRAGLVDWLIRISPIT